MRKTNVRSHTRKTKRKNTIVKRHIRNTQYGEYNKYGKIGEIREMNGVKMINTKDGLRWIK